MSVEKVRRETTALLTSKTTQTRPQVFSVNSSINCNFACTFDVIRSIWESSSKLDREQLVMINYASDFSQSETEKYFKWIILTIIYCFHRFYFSDFFLCVLITVGVWEAKYYEAETTFAFFFVWAQTLQDGRTLYFQKNNFFFCFSIFRFLPRKWRHKIGSKSKISRYDKTNK